MTGLEFLKKCQGREGQEETEKQFQNKGDSE